MLLFLSVINAGVHLPFFRFAAPAGIILLPLTLVCLLLSVFHPEKPIQVWNLVLTLGGLSILYGLSAFA